MAGSIRGRPDRGADAWELRVVLGRDATGRVRHRSVTFRGSRRAAERELARLVADQGTEPERPVHQQERSWGPGTTINDAVERWRRNGWQALSPNTVRGYEGVWRRHVRDSIGRRRITDLSPYDLECYLRDLKASGAGPTTVRLVRALLHRSCRLARKWSGNRLPNPVADTELPGWAPEERPRPVRSPDPEEVLALLDAARYADPQVATLIRLATATGMRRGEACALRWADIDRDGGTIMVDEGAVGTAEGMVTRSPKTRPSTRRVAVDAGTLEQVAELRSHQQHLADRAEVALGPEGFAFSFEPGGGPSSPRHHQPRLRRGPGRRGGGEGRPPPLPPPLPAHPPGQRDQRGPEASPPGLVHRAHGPPLHRRCSRRGPPGRRAHGRPSPPTGRGSEAGGRWHARRERAGSRPRPLEGPPEHNDLAWFRVDRPCGSLGS
ncbi:MAG TPA: tyrosine-type recombinase/integrase [Acidimicrobiales bacterium]|nr:tyrosine-type recombinase/integrase [Acidimicrobiales bacterium]